MAKQDRHVLAVSPQVWTLGLALCLSACATYVPPSPELGNPEAVAETFVHALPDAPDVIPDWWTQFDDPVLVSLVERALSENRSLEAARANVRAANMLIRRSRLEHGFNTSTGGGATLDNNPGQSNVELTFRGSTNASWEFDLFGRIDALVRSAAFNEDAVIEAQRDVAVVVAAQTAQAYVDLRGAQARLSVAEDNAALQAEALDLLTQLVEAGRSNELDLDRSRTLYLTTRASLPTFRAAVETATARLTALTGTTDPETAPLFQSLGEIGTIPVHNATLAVGTPIDLIRRRPDIRQAEARLGEQLALGEIERTRLFPTLTFDTGLQALFGNLGGFTTVNGFGFSVGPALTWEGPDLRQVRTDIAIIDAQSEAAFANYEQTIFDALADVESALALYQREMERREDLQSATDSAANALKLARLRFEEGLDDFLDVLDAQRTLLEAQDGLVQNDLLITTYTISAYRALGGMWTDAELRAAADESQTL